MEEIIGEDINKENKKEFFLNKPSTTKMNLDNFYSFHYKTNTGSDFNFKSRKNMAKENKKEKIRKILIGKIFHTSFMPRNINYLLLTLFLMTFSNNKPFITQNKFANITLKIKGKGKKAIFGEEFKTSSYPNLITINNSSKISKVYTQYDFDLEENIVKLRWNKKIKECRYMFRYNEFITEIDLSNFDTSEAINIDHMFQGLKSLISLNLSNFDTSKVTEIDNMFYNCVLLTSLNLSNFDTSKVTDMNNMFHGCINLRYINLKNFKENLLGEYQNMFVDVPNNVIICINEDITKDKIFPQIKDKKCYSIDCSDDLISKKNITKYENNIYNCCETPKGYYLDKNDFLYKKCYEACETCEIKGNNKTHNCLKCNTKLPFKVSINNYLNCYVNCNNYYYFDNTSNFHCTSNLSCPIDYPKLVQDTKECIKLDIKNMIQNIPKFIKNETEGVDKEEEIKYYDTVLENIETGFVSEYYDTSNLDSGEEEVIEIDNMKVTLTTTQNQINNTNNNMTAIYLGECEILLRKFYNISDDKLLYMKKIDVTNDGMKIPKVEFDIFCKLTGSNLIKLNKSVCESSEYSLSIPVDISDDLDKLNTSGEYYNDRCSKATSNSGTDISLKDRQKVFVEDNKTVCQDDCYFYDYDKDTQKANCSCKITESASSIVDMTINSTKLYENFDEVKTEFSNLGVTSCNVFASKENIQSNTGFYLLLIILSLFIIIFIIFCTKGYRNLENKIDEVIYKRFNNENKSKQKQKDNKIKRTITKENRNTLILIYKFNLKNVII